MVPWIQIYSNLLTHPKTARLADGLGLTSQQVSPDVIATGILVSLWTWAIQNAYDGDLSKSSPRLIAEVCRWKKKPEKLLEALQTAGYLDETGKLHDWETYTVLYIDAENNRKSNDKKRAREYRERKQNREQGT